MIIIDDIDQLSPEWYALHAGVPGAASFDRVVKANGDPSKQREEYLYELAGERRIGTREDGYMSWDMRKGIEREGEARTYYEYLTGEVVRQVGFVFKNEERRVGCSPDGLILGKAVADIYPDITYDDAYLTGLEIKAPKMKNHVKTLLEREVPDDKWIQIQGCMWVCSFHSWQFLSYFPDMDPVILTVERDYKFTSDLEHEMMSFLDELDEVYKELTEKTG